MPTKLPPNEAELYKRCDEVLHYIWDPIGVSGCPSARDEYHSYIPQIFALVNENAEPSRIADHLVEIMSDRMSLNPNRQKALIVAKTLLDWRECINEASVRDLLNDR